MFLLNQEKFPFAEEKLQTLARVEELGFKAMVIIQFEN